MGKMIWARPSARPKEKSMQDYDRQVLATLADLVHFNTVEVLIILAHSLDELYMDQ